MACSYPQILVWVIDIASALQKATFPDLILRLEIKLDQDWG